jgi:hypothetical protein
MAKVIGKISAPGGKYIKDGEEKTRWINCGILLDTDKGYRIKLDALPVNMGEGWLSVFPPDEERQQARPAAAAAPAPAAGEEDIPF